MAERDLHSRLRLGVRRLGGRLDKLAPTSKGIPDALVLLPGGRAVLVELKETTGRISPAQRLYHEQAARLGTTVVVLRGAGEIDAWIEATRASLAASPASGAPGRPPVPRPT